MSKTSTIRTFICIELPQALRVLLAKFQDSLKRPGADVSWVKPSNIHFTLKFLGEVPEQKLPMICETVEKAARAVPALEIQVKGTGCFPSTRNPRVILVGIQPVPSQLQELYELIEVGLSDIGYARDDRPFSPHLTIGRVKSPRNLQALMRQIQEFEFRGEIVSVRTVTVMRSDLRPAGAVYSPIKVFPLLGKAEHN